MNERRSSFLRPWVALVRGLAILGGLVGGILLLAALPSLPHSPERAIRKAHREPDFLVFGGLVVLVGTPFVLHAFASRQGRYRVGPTELEVRSGWLTKTLTTLRYADVRSVSMSSGLLMRLLGRADLRIVASAAPFQLTLYGISGAEELRQYLLERSASLRELEADEDLGRKTQERLLQVLVRLEKKLPPDKA